MDRLKINGPDQDQLNSNQLIYYYFIAGWTWSRSNWLTRDRSIKEWKLELNNQPTMKADINAIILISSCKLDIILNNHEKS